MHFFRSDYPAMGKDTVPLAPYYDEDYYQRERESVFKGQWLFMGREEEVSKVGDYLVKDIKVIDSSVIVLRGKDDKLRAFHNSCQHRANRLLMPGHGHVDLGFACGFHGWTYGLEGDLLYVPDENCFHGLEKAKNGLKPLACDTWKGFIFINTDPAPSVSLLEFIGVEMDEQVGEFPFNTHELAASYRAELQVNWKYLAEAFQEAYHVVAVHPNTVADKVTVSRWEMERQAALRGEPSPNIPPDPQPPHFFSSVRLWERHRSMSLFGKPESKKENKLPPAINLFSRLAAAPLIHPKTGLNPEKNPSWGADLQFFFPNTELLMVSPTWYAAITFWPLAANSTLFELGFYRQPPRNAGELLAMESIEANFRDVIREDVAALEPAQAMLRSGGVDSLWLSDQEIPARHSFETVDRHVRGVNSK